MGSVPRGASSTETRGDARRLLLAIGVAVAAVVVAWLALANDGGRRDSAGSSSGERDSRGVETAIPARPVRHVREARPAPDAGP
jgi:hypothetical protein